jgi:nitrite reductase (NADH) small subunit/3-phenylpropionate/trans-cinnamate dioxygenase ferredoxin subunit
MAWTSLCELNELTEGEGKYVEIGGFRLALFLHEGNVFVMDNYCPHAGGNLSAGWVQDGCAICPWHAWPFRLDNGELRGTPGVKVQTYKTRIYRLEGKPELVQAELPMY